MIRIDLNSGRCDMLVEEEEIERRRQETPPPVPVTQTPWQKIYRHETTQLSDGAVLRSAQGFHRIARTPPRHNH
jgi:xylonate dehydratase